MMASPMYLSMVPRWVWMTRVMGVRYSFISCDRSLGWRASEMLVKSRTSANITVSSRLSLSMDAVSLRVSISSTSSGGMYWLNILERWRLPRDSMKKPYNRWNTYRASRNTSGGIKGNTTVPYFHSARLPRRITTPVPTATSAPVTTDRVMATQVMSTEMASNKNNKAPRRYCGCAFMTRLSKIPDSRLAWTSTPG